MNQHFTKFRRKKIEINCDKSWRAPRRLETFQDLNLRLGIHTKYYADTKWGLKFYSNLVITILTTNRAYQIWHNFRKWNTWKFKPIIEKVRNKYCSPILSFFIEYNFQEESTKNYILNAWKSIKLHLKVVV